ncbi:MAG: pentapeptide repeat-containing protein [Desulfobacter sp.]|nr:pentapeptide repeat-containing protein [Desulfobacter sp.]
MIRFFNIFSLVIFLSLLCTVHARAFDEKDLSRLKQTKQCPGCNLTGAKLDGADLTGADLSGVNLDVVLSGVTWTNGCKCKNYKCSNCR